MIEVVALTLAFGVYGIATSVLYGWYYDSVAAARLDKQAEVLRSKRGSS